MPNSPKCSKYDVTIIVIMNFNNLIKDKIQLQNQLQPKVTILLNKINITIYFENITVKLHVLYALNRLVKFCVNQILFTI